MSRRPHDTDTRKLISGRWYVRADDKTSWYLEEPPVHAGGEPEPAPEISPTSSEHVNGTGVGGDL